MLLHNYLLLLAFDVCIHSFVWTVVRPVRQKVTLSAQPSLASMLRRATSEAMGQNRPRARSMQTRLATAFGRVQPLVGQPPLAWPSRRAADCWLVVFDWLRSLLFLYPVNISHQPIIVKTNRRLFSVKVCSCLQRRRSLLDIWLNPLVQPVENLWVNFLCGISPEQEVTVAIIR